MAKERGVDSDVKGIAKFSVPPAWYSLLDFIYPPFCLSCSDSLPDGRQRVCVRCWNAIGRSSRDLPLFLETRKKLLTSELVDDLVSCFVFEKEGPFQHIAHALKYQGYESLGLELGRRLGTVFREWELAGDMLVPIPLHRRKQRERGYNQAEQVARGVFRVTSIPVRTDLVRRTRFTQSQTTLSIEERKKNMEAAFEVVPGKENAVNGRCIVLVDDVITTGATIVACASALRDAGARRVIASSAALAA